MEEIAETFKELGLTEHIFYGAADVSRLVEQTSLGKETQEECDRESALHTLRDRSLEDIVATLSQEDISNNL